MTTTLPPSSSPSLILTHPTPLESQQIWALTSASWRGALTPSQYIIDAHSLLSAPLHLAGGMTMWILTSSSSPENQRQILASCESIRKPALWRAGGEDVMVEECVVHGVASVYTAPEYRGKGYASRMLRELRVRLRDWQSEKGRVVGSVLFSDIGKSFYRSLGWETYPSQHLQFAPSSTIQISLNLQFLEAEDLGPLCKIQEDIARKILTKKSSPRKAQMMLLPHEPSFSWLHQKEDFLASQVYNKPAVRKGAIIGSPGSRTWAIWTRLCSDPIEAPDADNTLYILKLVLEDDRDEDRDLQVAQLKAVLEAAQAEAEEWRLRAVKMWNPMPLVEELVRRTGVVCEKVDREESSISSLLWYGDGKEEGVEWVGDEKYGWC